MTDIAERMERDLTDLQNEQNRIFGYLLDNEHFQYTISPIARAYLYGVDTHTLDPFDPMSLFPLNQPPPVTQPPLLPTPPAVND